MIASPLTGHTGSFSQLAYRTTVLSSSQFTPFYVAQVLIVNKMCHWCGVHPMSGQHEALIFAGSGDSVFISESVSLLENLTEWSVHKDRVLWLNDQEK